MSHIHAASALLFLSLPYALAVPVAQANGVKQLLPAFQLLGNSSPARAATPSPVVNIAAPLSAVNSIINPSALINLVAPVNALLSPLKVSTSSRVSVSTAPTLSGASTSVPSLPSTSISLPAVSSASVSVPTITSALTSVIGLPSLAIVFDGVSAASAIAASVASDVSPLADVVADLTTRIEVALPTPAASDISSLTGGVLTSPDVTSPDATSPDESVESTSTDEPVESLIPDPGFQGGPENQIINPVPNPVIPIPTPIDDNDDDTTETEAPDALETEAAPLDDTSPSDAVEISELIPTSNATVLLNSTLANSSEPIVTEEPTAILLTEPSDDVSINTSDDFVLPLETFLPAPFANATVILNGSVADSNVTNISEPVVTDEPILLPEPTDDIFIDPLLRTDDVLIDPNTNLPVETDVPLPEEPGVPKTSSEPVQLFNPPKDSVELSTFIDIMQGIANVLSNIFHVIPPGEVESEPAEDDDDTAEDTVPGVPEPELNVPNVPVPLINATDNATILERRQFYGANRAIPPLDPVIVSDIMRSVLEIITTIFRQVTKAVPAAAAAAPDLPVVLPSVINPNLPTTILPIMPTEVPQLDLPTDIDWSDLPELTTGLPNVGLPSVALPDIALPTLPVLPSLAADVLPTDIPIDLPTGVPEDLLPNLVPSLAADVLPTDIPIDLPTGAPETLLSNLASAAPIDTILPPVQLLTAVANSLPTGVADLPTELPTDLPADLFGDLPIELSTDLGALANRVSRLAKRASFVMTAEQEQLLNVIHANNAELKEVLEQLKALQQRRLRKRQSANVYAGAEAGLTGPQLFPVILNLINTLLEIVNGLSGVQTIAPNDLNSLLAGALASVSGLTPATPMVPATGLGALGSLGGLEAPVVPIPSGSVIPTLDGALGSLGGLAAPLVSGVPTSIPSLVPGLDLGALGSLGGLAVPLASLAPPVLPSLVPGLDLGALGSLGGLATPLVSGVPVATPSLVPGLDLGALGSLGGLAAPVVSGVPAIVPSILPSLVPGVDLGALGSLGGLAAPVSSALSLLPSLPTILPIDPRDEAIEKRQLSGALGGLGSIGGLGGVISNTKSSSAKSSSTTGGVIPPATLLAPILGAVSPVASPVVNLLNGLLAGGSAAGLAPVVSSVAGASIVPSPSAVVNALDGLLAGGSAAGLGGVVSPLPLVGSLPIVSSPPVADLLQNVGPLPVVSPVADVVNGLFDSTLPSVPDLASVLPLPGVPDIASVLPLPTLPTAEPLALLGDLPSVPDIASGLPLPSLPTAEPLALLGDLPVASPVADTLGLFDSSLPELPNVASLLPAASILPALLDTVPGADAVPEALNNLLAGNSAAGLTPAVGDVPGATGLLPPIQAVDEVLKGLLPDTSPLQTGIAPPVADVIKPLLEPVGAVATPLLQGVDPLLAPLEGVAASLTQGLSPITNIVPTSGPQLPGLDSLLAPVIDPLKIGQPGGLRPLGPPILDALTPVTNPLAPVVAPVTPVTGAVSSILPEAALKQIQGVLQTLRRLLGIPPDSTPLPIRKRDAPAPVEKRQIFTNAAVKKFLLQWHTIGASMAKVSPQTVNDLMQVFMDPSANPPTATALSKYDASLRNFILSFYTFAQYMDDAGVSPEEKIQMLRIMFDDTSMNSGFKKTKRSMRYGRRQLWIAEDGEPDTGPSLDDAEKLGHNALLALLGPAGSLDPLELFRPQNRVYDPIDYYEEAEPTEGSIGISDGSDDSALGDDAASTDDSEPTEEEYNDYMDYFGDSH